MTNSPFIIYSLPRSRSAWLSQFLTYDTFECYHEVSVFLRSIEEVKAFLNSGDVGAADTGVAYGYQLIRHMAPNIKEVVVLRPVEEVVQSILRLNVSGIAKYDEPLLRKNMAYGRRMLEKIAKDDNVLVVNYHDLHKEEVCQNIFEHCLPYDFDRNRWLKLKDKNIQVDFRAFLKYYLDHKTEIDKFKKDCRMELWRLARAGDVKSVKWEIKYAERR